MSRPVVNARLNLLKYGKEMLLQEGYFSLSVNRLTKTCNMATGTFYRYFPGKSDLVVVIVQTDWNAMLTRMETISKQKITFAEKLRGIFMELKGFTDLYENIWVQFGAEKGNVERFRAIRTTCLQQVADLVTDLLRARSSARADITLTMADTALATLIVQNMLIIARTEVLTIDAFLTILGKWALVPKEHAPKK